MLLPLLIVVVLADVIANVMADVFTICGRWNSHFICDKENFFLRHHQHQVSLQGKHFPIHLDEARSVGLAKACVIQKIYSVPEKISWNHIIQTE